MPPRIVVVIVTHNSEDSIGGLLDSMPTGLGGLAASIVVVDNSSGDRTRAIVRARSDCALLEAANNGYAAGINLGAGSVDSADVIVILNPDTILLSGAISRLVDTLNDPRVGIAVPKVLNADRTLYLSLRREPTLLRALGLTRTGLSGLSEYISRPEAYETKRDVDWALGAIMAVAGDCYRELGGWDESYFLYSEETDFCLTARDAGYLTRYEPCATAIHVGGGSGQSDNTHAMQTINRVRLYARRHSRVASWLYFSLTILSECSWYLRGHRQSRFAVKALLAPGTRPTQLNASDTIIPR